MSFFIHFSFFSFIHLHSISSSLYSLFIFTSIFLFFNLAYFYLIFTSILLFSFLLIFPLPFFLTYIFNPIFISHFPCLFLGYIRAASSVANRGIPKRARMVSYVGEPKNTASANASGPLVQTGLIRHRVMHHQGLMHYFIYFFLLIFRYFLLARYTRYALWHRVM